MEENTFSFKNHFADESSAAYSKQIRKTSQWMSQKELIAVATTLQVPVRVLIQPAARWKQKVDAL